MPQDSALPGGLGLGRSGRPTALAPRAFGTGSAAGSAISEGSEPWLTTQGSAAL